MPNLNKKEIEFFQTIMKRIGCDKGDCGTYFNLEIGEVALAEFEERKKKYSGKCSRCQKHLVLRGTELERFIKTMGIPTIQVTKTTFDKFFKEK